MSRFWRIICLVLFAIFLAMIATPWLYPPVPRAFRTEIPVAQRLYIHSVTGVLVGVVWAICFRPQLEKGRLSILSLFALAAMQALYLWLVRVMHPWG